MKPSFILHKDSLCVLEELTDEQRGKLFYAIYCYQIGQEIELDMLTKIAFSQFKNQFIRDEEQYQNTCKRRAEAGSKGGKQKVANASKSKQSVAKVAENKKKSKSNSDSKKEERIYINSKYANDLFIEYLVLRKKMKLSNSESVITRLLNKLNEYFSKGHSIEDVISNAINSSWKDFYEPKQQTQNNMSFKQQDKETSNRKINAYLDSGYSLRDTHEIQEVEVIGYDN